MPNMKCLGSVFLVNVTVNLQNRDGRDQRDIRDQIQDTSLYSYLHYNTILSIIPI